MSLASCPRRRWRRNTARPAASTPCSVNTDLDVSMAMRLISVMDGLQFVFLTAELWHQMPRGRPPQRIRQHVVECLALVGVIRERVAEGDLLRVMAGHQH